MSLIIIVYVFYSYFVTNNIIITILLITIIDETRINLLIKHVMMTGCIILAYKIFIVPED